MEEKILEAAAKVFTEKVYAATKTRDIAEAAGISVGNLAYHFTNKEAIVTALHAEVIDRQQDLMTNYRVVPLFDYIDLLLQDTYALQSCYIFFYLDILEITRTYPDIGNHHRQNITRQIAQLESILQFNVSRGALQFVKGQERTDSLAVQIWMMLDMWHIRNMILPQSRGDLKSYLDDVWSVFIPYFTAMGALEYKQMVALRKDPSDEDQPEESLEKTF